MAEGARVDSLEALRDFKTVLWKFQEAAVVALGDAESEMTRTLLWLETEQDSHWRGQVRKCQETIARCKEAVRMKKVFKDATGRQQSAVDEEKALQIAVKRLAEAEQKHASVRKWSRQLQKEIERYKGSVQRFATTVQSDIPAAAAHLESLSAKLDAYVSLRADGMGTGQMQQADPAAGAQTSSMARGHAAGSVPTAQVSFAVPIIPDDQQNALAAIEAERSAPLVDAHIALDPAASQATQVVLRRSTPASGEDSGWLITPDQPGQTSASQTIPVSDLLESRPDLRDLLGLPAGFSVIIGQTGILAVADPAGQNVWQPPSRRVAESESEHGRL